MSKKIGLFGGTFNPPHLGHVNSVQQVVGNLGLDKVIVMPTFKSPHRQNEEMISAVHRFEMTRRAFAELSIVEVSDFELKKEGISYTIETIEHLRKQYPSDQLYLIVGMDQFSNFHLWKDYKEILSHCQLVVTSRPGVAFIPANEQLPNNLQKPYIISLEDTDISSTELRRSLAIGEDVGSLLNKDVKNYIEQEKLYPPIKDILKNYEVLTQFCAQVLCDGKAVNIIAKDLRGEDKPMEFALIASGTSRKHAMALAEQVARQVKEYKTNPLNIDGQVEGQWIVLDYGSLMVHVFYDFTRQEYQLEKLWGDSKDLELHLK